MIFINDTLVDLQKFPDGTPLIRVEHDADDLVFTWKYDNMEELFVLQCLSEKFGNYKQTLRLPYIPNARMDRVKNKDEVFTLKTFANVINNLIFEKVIVNNAHSDVALALIDNVENVYTDYNEIFNRSRSLANFVDTIMFPDEGACKRYAGLDLFKNYNIVTGYKSRDWRTGVINGLGIIGNTDDIKGKNILIVDDICSRGGTFKYSADELKKLGANDIRVMVSHCENCVDIEMLKIAGVSKIYTTDSICRLNNNFVEVYNV